MLYRKTHNSESQSDQSYWYLREVQDLVNMPLQTPSTSLRTINLVDPRSGEPICVGDLVELPGTQALVVMASDGRMLHLLLGSDLSHSRGITLSQGIARSICADQGHLVIALSTGELARVGIFSLLGKNEGDTGSTVIDFDLLKAQHSDITHAGGIDLTVVRMVALRSRDAFTRVLLCGPTLSDLWIATWSMPKAQVQQLTLSASKAVQGSTTFQQACLCQSSGLVYLADCQGGRVFELDLDSDRPLKVIAGDGVRNSSAWPQCGPANSTRLGAITGICAFEISEEFAQRLSSCGNTDQSARVVGETVS